MRTFWMALVLGSALWTVACEKRPCQEFLDEQAKSAEERGLQHLGVQRNGDVLMWGWVDLPQGLLEVLAFAPIDAPAPDDDKAEDLGECRVPDSDELRKAYKLKAAIPKPEPQPASDPRRA